MSIEELPSDELIEMTDLLYRVVNAAGGNSACHCCHKFIASGEKFKMATVRKVIVKIGYGRMTYASGIVQVISGAKESDEAIIDETKEVMLCHECTPEMFEKKQLNSAIDDAEAFKKYTTIGAAVCLVRG